jgi:hypothetical protein
MRGRREDAHDKRGFLHLVRQNLAPPSLVFRPLALGHLQALPSEEEEMKKPARKPRKPPAMRKTSAYIEALTFVDCPHCHKVECLGHTDWDGYDELICGACGEAYLAKGDVLND